MIEVPPAGSSESELTRTASSAMAVCTIAAVDPVITTSRPCASNRMARVMPGALQRINR